MVAKYVLLRKDSAPLQKRQTAGRPDAGLAGFALDSGQLALCFYNPNSTTSPTVTTPVSTTSAVIPPWPRTAE